MFTRGLQDYYYLGSLKTLKTDVTRALEEERKRRHYIRHAGHYHNGF